MQDLENPVFLVNESDNQNLIPFAQPALQLGRQGTGDKNDRNCETSWVDTAGGQHCDKTVGKD